MLFRSYEPMLSTTNSRVSPCFAYRGLKNVNESEASYVSRLEHEIDAEFQRIGPENVAAFIAEPVVGAALGCVGACGFVIFVVERCLYVELRFDPSRRARSCLVICQCCNRLQVVSKNGDKYKYYSSSHNISSVSLCRAV